MKICVLNFSGNVGKSTIAAHLLQPRLNAQVFSVESLNFDAHVHERRDDVGARAPLSHGRLDLGQQRRDAAGL